MQIYRFLGTQCPYSYCSFNFEIAKVNVFVLLLKYFQCMKIIWKQGQISFDEKFTCSLHNQLWRLWHMTIFTNLNVASTFYTAKCWQGSRSALKKHTYLMTILLFILSSFEILGKEKKGKDRTLINIYWLINQKYLWY